MNYYAYVPTSEGKEPIGTGNRMIMHLKTLRGAVNRAKKVWGEKSFVVKTFTNFYDEKTFKTVYTR